MTYEIPLSRGLSALVDDADAERVLAVGKWYADRSCQTFYARKNYWTGSGYVSLRMHTFLTGWAFTDHANGDGLDNRRANLREVTGGQNTWNRARRSDNTSGFKGVSRHTSGRWRAYIQKDGGRLALGTYATPEEAALVYDLAAIDLFGEFARLNFPLGDTA